MHWMRVRRGTLGLRGHPPAAFLKSVLCRRAGAARPTTWNNVSGVHTRLCDLAQREPKRNRKNELVVVVAGVWAATIEWCTTVAVGWFAPNSKLEKMLLITIDKWFQYGIFKGKRLKQIRGTGTCDWTKINVEKVKSWYFERCSRETNL